MRSLLVLGFLLASSAAHAAGGMSTGGGSAVVCRDANNAITKAELLDVFEGRERFGQAIPEATGQPEDQVQAAIGRLSSNPALQGFVSRTYDDVYTRRIFLAPYIGLNTSTDLGKDYAVYILDGCHLEQVGYYEADGQLRIATSVFSHLSPTSQAGFLLHETFYRLTRSLVGAQDSAAARKLVAEILSTSTSDAQATTDLAQALKGDPNGNVFLPLTYQPNVGFDVYIETNGCDAAVSAFSSDIKGNVLSAFKFAGTSTWSFSADESLAEIDLAPVECQINLYRVYYAKQLVFEQKAVEIGNQPKILVSWQPAPKKRGPGM